MILTLVFLFGTVAAQAVNEVRCRVVHKVSPPRLSIEFTTLLLTCFKHIVMKMQWSSAGQI